MALPLIQLVGVHEYMHHTTGMATFKKSKGLLKVYRAVHFSPALRVKQRSDAINTET